MKTVITNVPGIREKPRQMRRKRVVDQKSHASRGTTSSPLHGGSRGEVQTLADVLGLEIGIVSQNLLFGHASRKHPEYGRNWNACLTSPHYRNAGALLRAMLPHRIAADHGRLRCDAP